MISFLPPNPDRVTLNPNWLRAEVAESLGAIKELSSYLSFLEAARDQKSKTSSRRSVSFEREVLGNARRAEQSARRLFGGTLRVLKHLKSAGIVDQAMNHWTTEIEKRGKLSFAEHWNELLQDPKTHERFQQAGVSSLTLSRLSEAATRLTRPVEVRDGKLIIRGEGDRTIVLKRRQLLGGTIADVLYHNQFDAAAELFERTDVIPGDTLATVHATEELQVDPLEVVLAIATRAQRMVTAHVRKLEDIGLAVYEGNEAAVVGAVIAAVLVVAAILVAIICEATESEGEVCDVVTLVLSALGVITLVITCAENPENCEIVLGASASRLQSFDGSFSFSR